MSTCKFESFPCQFFGSWTCLTIGFDKAMDRCGPKTMDRFSNKNNTPVDRPGRFTGFKQMRNWNHFVGFHPINIEKTIMLHNDVNLGDVSYNIQLHQKTINNSQLMNFGHIHPTSQFLILSPSSPSTTFLMSNPRPIFFPVPEPPPSNLFYIWPRSKI